MRLLVTPRSQNALFRRVRFSSPGQTSGRLTERRSLCPLPHGKAQSVPTTSRKGALCTHRLTERRSLCQLSHGKTHFAQSAGCRMRFSVRHGCVMRFSVRRRLQNALFRRVRFSSPGQTSGRLTERRTLYPPPHGKAQSVPTTSRKSALCPTGGLQDALFRESAHLECAFW